MTSRYGRAGSPTGASRRYLDPARSSTGSVYNTYDPPSSYRHRDSFTSPRTSGERVVPISSETYINGQRVNSAAPPRSTYDAYDPRPRRSTYDEAPRAPSSSAGSSYMQPAVVHHSSNRGVSPATRSVNYESDRHVSSSAAPKREHKKVYSVDDGKTTRLVPAPEKDIPRRDSADTRLPPPPADRSRRDYHLSGPAKKAGTGEESGGYEYTDARGMYRDTEPKWRPRRGSVDGVGRERPSSMIEPYGNTRNTPREPGPPPATRGFDKINTSLGRHGSVTGSITSPSQQRDRGYGSTSSGYSEDENYRVAPRILPADRAEASYKLPSERGEIYSPAREEFGPRRESRGLSRRFEDADITSRGFGIRAPSVEPRRSREDSIDRYSGYSAEPYAKPLPRDYPRDRDSGRDGSSGESDRREQERVRELPRSKKESPPLRNGDLPPTRDVPRELPREREVIRPRDVLSAKERLSGDALPVRDEPPGRLRDGPVERLRDPDLDDRRRERDRDHPSRSRDLDPRLDEDRPVYDKRSERELYAERDPYEKRPERAVEEPKRLRDTREGYEDSVVSHSSSGVGAGLAGTAATGAAAYGAKQVYDRRQHEDAPINDRMEKPKASAKDKRELDPTVPGATEGRNDSHLLIDRIAEADVNGRLRGRFAETSPEDIDRARKRNYVGKDDVSENGRLPEGKVKKPEILDPEEDYRRRVQQETERVHVPLDDDHHHPAEDARDRRHRDQRNEPDERAASGKHRDHDDESVSDHTMDAQALTRYKPADDEGSEVTRFTDEPTEIVPRKNRVSIVEPPKEIKNPKGILRKPTEKFPEDPNPIREGVAPLKDGKTKDVPPGARWTKINRSMVNPEALEEAQERFEERQEHVIVLRVLTREEIQKFADRTKEIRDSRYERDHKDRRSRRDGRREHEGTDDSRDDDEEKTRDRA